jgi:hypothetical protein
MKVQQLLKQCKRIIHAIFFNVKKDSGLSSQVSQEKKKEFISLEQLNIKVFYKILLSEKNLSLLKVSDPQSNWEILLDEYWNYVDAKKYASNIRKSVSILKKENKITTLSAIVMKMEMGHRCKELKDWGYNTKEQAIQALRVLKTNYKIEVLKSNQKKITGSKTLDIYKDCALLENVLKRQIDLEKCNVLMWVSYNNLAKEMTKKK